MNKEQFLKQLNDGLGKLPEYEREDIIQDFHEHFDIGLNEGKSEQEIISSLGSPQKIAKEMVATYFVDQVETSSSAGNVMRATWAVIGLGFFNLIIVLGPFIGIVAIVLGGWVMSAGFTVAPLLVLLNRLIYPSSLHLFDLFTSIALCGLGLFIGVGMYYLTRAAISGFNRYLKFNINFVKGGLNG